MKIATFLIPTAVCLDLNASDKRGLIEELGSLLARAYPSLNGKDISEVLIERERLTTTAFGDHVAIPHTRTRHVQRVCGAVGISRKGVDFEAIDGKSVHLFFAVLSPLDKTEDHLKAIARVSRHLRNPVFRELAMKAATPEELFDMILFEDEKSG